MRHGGLHHRRNVTRSDRYQSAVPNRHGTWPGVFALANGLLAGSTIRDEDREWLRAANARAQAAYPDPSTTDPDCYDPVASPGARSWFRVEATELLAMSAGYLDLLDRHGIPWVELRTSTPGRVVYEDDVQVVAVPFTHPEDWPFGVRG